MAVEPDSNPGSSLRSPAPSVPGRQHADGAGHEAGGEVHPIVKRKGTPAVHSLELRRREAHRLFSVSPRPDRTMSVGLTKGSDSTMGIATRGASYITEPGHSSSVCGRAGNAVLLDIPIVSTTGDSLELVRRETLRFFSVSPRPHSARQTGVNWTVEAA